MIPRPRPATPQEGAEMKYRKRPVVIEAMQFNGSVSSADKIEVWSRGQAIMQIDDKFQTFLAIKTLEGTMRADADDFVICGVNGEFYPCKPDIFRATYEPVEQ